MDHFRWHRICTVSNAGCWDRQWGDWGLAASRMKRRGFLHFSYRALMIAKVLHGQLEKAALISSPSRQGTALGAAGRSGGPIGQAAGLRRCVGVGCSKT